MGPRAGTGPGAVCTLHRLARMSVSCCWGRWVGGGLLPRICAVKQQLGKEERSTAASARNLPQQTWIHGCRREGARLFAVLGRA